MVCAIAGNHAHFALAKKRNRLSASMPSDQGLLVVGGALHRHRRPRPAVDVALHPHPPGRALQHRGKSAALLTRNNGSTPIQGPGMPPTSNLASIKAQEVCRRCGSWVWILTEGVHWQLSNTIGGTLLTSFLQGRSRLTPSLCLETGTVPADTSTSAMRTPARKVSTFHWKSSDCQTAGFVGD